MNDHVGKPFELDELVKILLLHCGRASETAVLSVVVTDQALGGAVPHASIAPAVLDLDAALARTGNNVGLFVQVIRSFVKDLPPMLAHVRDHLQATDVAQAQRVLHTLKGLAATVGAMQLSRTAAQMEAQCKVAWDPAHGMELLDRLQQAATSAAAAMEEACNRLTPTPSPTSPSSATSAPNGQFQDHLHTLENMLLQNDMSALEQFAAFSGAHGAALGPALEPLAEAMASLDFAQAAQICRSLR
jgi:HPt (histidine-containing phosphotransfer) domain-containing protein